MGALAERLLSLPAPDLPACVERAEALIERVDPEALYDERDLLDHLAGRRVAIEDPGTIVGRALVNDLSSLVERLSEAAGQTPGDLGPGALDADALADRWRVSTKTIARYRREGLIARRVRVGRRRAVMFTANAVERFEKRSAERLDRAARFTRLGEGEDERLLARARRYHARFGWTLNRVARRLADRTGRSVEGVRQVLIRHDAGAAAPIFERSGPPNERERAVLARALRRGVEPADLADRAGRSVASVRRAATEHRAALLRELDLAGPTLPTFTRPEAREVLLGSAPVRTGLGAPGVDDLAAFLTDARVRRVPKPKEESARAIALHYLRADAARRIASLDRTTAQPGEVDRAETDLRWASHLKAELVRPSLASIVETLEAAAGVALEELPARDLPDLLRRALAAASGAVDRYDPAHAGRVAAPIGLAVTRVASAWAQGRGAERAPGRAQRRLREGVEFRDWTLALDPWQRWLAPDPRVVRALPALEERSRLVLAYRLGLAGDPPMTLGETAERLGTTVVHAARYERAATREALAHARAAGR